ncbi:hypothetical protein AB4865_06655 [Capnocytophaga sp. ARDL2]|uniref:hypothetical protein n=1 Tax=Capnocytophaga sp. ARDL2 TaxID=3238809 RepID=UPI0035593477
MEIIGKNLDTIEASYLKNTNKTVIIKKCIINIIDLEGIFDFNQKLIIEDCIINDFQIHSCWFINGLILKNNIVNNYIDYQMGGHNLKKIELTGNIFKSFFNFFDCQFKEKIEVTGNVFLEGSNLLGNKGESFENIFENGFLIENNVGKLNFNI